jgi:hypothetical protein
LPTDTPVTSPVVLLIVATAVFSLLHDPPGVELKSVEVDPIFIVVLPVIPAGIELTVIEPLVVIVPQPPDNETV